MKTLTFKPALLLVLFTGLLLGKPFATAAQTAYQAQSVNIKMTGTSTLHDWEMKSAKGSSDATFVLDAQNNITSITRLNFTMPAKTLKSEHTMMDNNTYKALKTSDHPNITFALTTATISPLGNNNYQLRCKGNLTIAGNNREVELVATGRYNPADRSFSVYGVQKMKMTDFNVKPPTVMLGTIKTGNDIAITYNLVFTR